MENNKKLQQLIDSLVENDRGSLIFCIKNSGILYTENELWSLSLEPKLQLRERIRQLILIELSQFESSLS